MRGAMEPPRMRRLPAFSPAMRDDEVGRHMIEHWRRQQMLSAKIELTRHFRFPDNIADFSRLIDDDEGR